METGFFLSIRTRLRSRNSAECGSDHLPRCDLLSRGDRGRGVTIQELHGQARRLRRGRARCQGDHGDGSKFFSAEVPVQGDRVSERLVEALRNPDFLAPT